MSGDEWVDYGTDFHTMTENEKEWTDNVITKYGSWLGYNKQYMTKSVLKNIDSIMGCI